MARPPSLRGWGGEVAQHGLATRLELTLSTSLSLSFCGLFTCVRDSSVNASVRGRRWLKARVWTVEVTRCFSRVDASLT